MPLLGKFDSLISRAHMYQKIALLQRSVSHLRASSSGARFDSVAGQPLKAWQREKLEAAFAKGRRHVSIQQLSTDTQMDRADVLDYLKGLSKLPKSAQDSILQTRQAVADAAEERQQVLAGASPRSSMAMTGQEREQRKNRERLHYQPGLEPYTPESAPWAQNFGRKKMPRVVEATLERIFESTPRPSEDVVAGLWDLHRLPKRRVLDWFAERRRAEASSRQRL